MPLRKDITAYSLIKTSFQHAAVFKKKQTNRPTKEWDRKDIEGFNAILQINGMTLCGILFRYDRPISKDTAKIKGGGDD